MVACRSATSAAARCMSFRSLRATKRIDKLEARGLVERSAHSTDRRSLLIGLTAEGLRVIDHLIVQHTENESRLLSACTPDELKAFDAVLRTLLGSIGGDAAHD